MSCELWLAKPTLTGGILGGVGPATLRFDVDG